MDFQKKIILLSFLVISFFCKAQSPGGVAGYQLWYKADNAASITIATGVSNWATTGGAASPLPVVQATTTAQPALNLGSAPYTLFSYMPYLTFTKANSQMLHNAALGTDIVGATGSIIMVIDKDPSAVTAFTYEEASTEFQFKPSFRIQTSSDGVFGYTFDFGGAPTEFSTFSAYEESCWGAGPNQSISLNSVLTTLPNNAHNTTYYPIIQSGIRVGANDLLEYSNCNIAEIIAYGGAALTLAKKNQIESYISIKYGITRGGNTGITNTYDYLSSAGAVVFSKTANTTYDNNIAGIARDDEGGAANSGLNKKQSISVNNNEAASVGLATIATTNATNLATFAADKSFFMWGSNGLPNSSSSATTSTAVVGGTYPAANFPPIITSMIQCVWRTQANVYPALTIGFETSQLVGYTPVNNLRLLINNTDATWTASTIISGAVINGTRVEFAVPAGSFSATNVFFTLASMDPLTKLPITLINFSGACNNGNVALNWSTASETNNNYFSIERTTDGTNWQTIGTVKGAGTSTQQKNYFFNDNNTNGTFYYRLCQTDFDGTTQCFNTIAVSCDNNSTKDWNIYPNPSNGKFTLQLSGGMEKDIQNIQIYNVLGQTIFSISAANNAIQPSESIDLSAYAKGIYFIKIQTALKTDAKKIIFQ